MANITFFCNKDNAQQVAELQCVMSMWAGFGLIGSLPSCEYLSSVKRNKAVVHSRLARLRLESGTHSRRAPHWHKGAFREGYLNERHWAFLAFLFSPSSDCCMCFISGGLKVFPFINTRRSVIPTGSSKCRRNGKVRMSRTLRKPQDAAYKVRDTDESASSWEQVYARLERVKI